MRVNLQLHFDKKKVINKFSKCKQWLLLRKQSYSFSAISQTDTMATRYTETDISIYHSFIYHPQLSVSSVTVAYKSQLIL